ncbi:oxidoreductase [Chryseobacterium phosphatilyticum]|uniref:Oxidoreductase n=1 Tax=Chryseobacterium phosphatilyticum TaxID=475075 RepID=A0A316XDM2_9FLAO|nr:alpha/beta fold hydrolase [Chryseobacterium phosphatilyticum]PWN70343.1 oxidoreductase [Chryseobacterium phosphatilyticum]
MKIALALCAVLLGLSMYSQKISGAVTNENEEPVSYCSISLGNEKASTITDVNGMYSLEVPDNTNKNGAIIFESNGYDSKKLTINEITRNPNIKLNKKTYAIQEINLTGKKTKNEVIGTERRPMLTFSKMFDQNIPTIEQGQIFTIYNWTKLNSYNFYIIPSSKFKEITLKLNIYTVKNDLPYQSALNENIVFTTSTTGWQSIDLRKYNLIYTGIDKLGITLQLVNHISQDNGEFVFGISARKTLSNDLLYRYQSQGSWEVSKGSFISNIDINYSKDKNEKGIEKMDKNDTNTENEELINYYKNKEKAKKTIYGQNKNGRFIDLKNAKIYYEEYGSGDPLFLLHGNNGSISDFYKQIPDLARHFKVIALDTRGQGKSTDLSTENYTYETFSDDLLAIIQELKLKKVNILGWSDGGNTGLTFTIKHPDMVNHLIVIGANITPEGIDPGMMETFRRQMNDKEIYNKRLLQLMIEQPQISTEQLNNIKTPVLIIAGSHDVIKEEHTRLINNSIPDSKLVIVPDATHYVPFEQPDSINKTVIDFLKQ